MLAVRAKIVLPIMMLLSKGVCGIKPALKLGQNNHKKKVPIIAKILEMYVILGLLFGKRLFPIIKLTVSPKYAPKV